MRLSGHERPGQMHPQIEGLVSERTTPLVHRDSGHGKSYLVMATAPCVAMGTPFLGAWPRRRPGSCTWIGSSPKMSRRGGLSKWRKDLRTIRPRMDSTTSASITRWRIVWSDWPNAMGPRHMVSWSLIRLGWYAEEIQSQPGSPFLSSVS